MFQSPGSLGGKTTQAITGIVNSILNSLILGAWTPYVPTLGSTSGTLTTASAAGRFLTIGKTTYINIKITITTNGSAAGAVTVTLPNNAKSNIVLLGREISITGNTLAAQNGGPGTGVLSVFTYNNGYPGGSGTVLVLGGVYENV